MKLDQIIKPDETQYYIYKCPVCGYTITTDDEDLRPVCPNCHQWVDAVVEEMREGDGQCDTDFHTRGVKMQ